MQTSVTQLHSASLRYAKVILSNRRIGEFHLHPSNRSSRDQGGSACKPRGQFPRLRPLRVLLVPHGRVAHWHAAHQTAQADGGRTGRHPVMDAQRPPRQPLERRSRSRAANQQALPGESQSILLFVRDPFGCQPPYSCSFCHQDLSKGC